MMNKGRKRLLAGVLTVALVGGTVVTTQPVQAAGAISIDAKHFPDANFRKAVKLFDENKNGKLETNENKQIKGLTESSWIFSENAVRNEGELGGKFKNIKGCEYLTSLEWVSVEDLKDTSYDFRKLKKLENITISGCQKLTSVNVKNLSKLRNVTIEGCDKLKSLDVSTLPSLTQVSIQYCNKFATLKTGAKNKKLASVEEIYSNAVKTVDLSKVKSLKSYYTNSKNFNYKNSKFNDVSKLVNLEISNSKAAATVDPKELKAVKHLDLRNSGLTTIDLSSNKNLTSLELAGNKFTTIDLTVNQKLKDINLSENALTALDVSKNTKLMQLDITKNSNLSEINLSKNTGLYDVYCWGCDLLDMISVNSTKEWCNIVVGENTKVMLPGTNYKRIVTTYDDDWNAIKTEYEVSNPVVPSELPKDQYDNCIKGDSETEYRIIVHTPSEYEE